MNLNECFCELAGIEPDIYDYEDLRGNVLQGERFPDYAKDPVAVLRVMREREDFCYIDHHREDDFISKVGLKTGPTPYIHIHNLLTPGAMLEAAIAFMEEHHESK